MSVYVQYTTGNYVTVIEDRKLTTYIHTLFKILAREQAVMMFVIPHILFSQMSTVVLWTRYQPFPQKSIPLLYPELSLTCHLMTSQMV